MGTYVSSCTGAADPDYSFSYVNGSVQVDPAPLTIAASSASVTYGSAPAGVTPTYSGFVNGDTAASLGTAPSCSTTATSSSPVGSYPSSCSGAIDPNYSISYVPGEVVVGSATLVVTASSGSMTYGGSVPSITPSYAGFVNGDSASSLTAQATCSTTATSIEPGGQLPHVVQRGGRSQLQHRVRGWCRDHRDRAPLGHGVVNLHDLRRLGARRSPPRTPAS